MKSKELKRAAKLISCLSDLREQYRVMKTGDWVLILTQASGHIHTTLPVSGVTVKDLLPTYEERIAYLVKEIDELGVTEENEEEKP